MSSSAPDNLPLPTSGGTYVRSGDELQAVHQTQPAAEAVATYPVAPDAAAAAPAPADAAQE